MALKFHCPYTGCKNSYKSRSWFRRHLKLHKKRGDRTFHSANIEVIEVE